MTTTPDPSPHLPSDERERSHLPSPTSFLPEKMVSLYDLANNSFSPMMDRGLLEKMFSSRLIFPLIGYNWIESWGEFNM
jgi:hypothetical protein